MPVLSNKEGVAENILSEKYADAVKSGDYNYILKSKEGDLVHVPEAEYQEAIQNGHQIPSQEEIGSLLNVSEKEGPGETLKAFGQGFGRSALPFVSTPLQTHLLGDTDQAINERSIRHPIAETAGEIAGLFAPTGVMGPIAKAGVAVERGVAALVSNPLIQKVGSKAAKLAVESALLQSNDEVHKMMAKDPNQTLDTAISHIGFSGLIGGVAGGAFGVGSKAVDFAKDGKLGKFLDILKSHFNGEPIVGFATIDKYLKKTGMGTGAAVAALITGHDPLSAFIAGQTVKVVGKATHEAIRAQYLKWLTSEAATNPGAFRKGVQFFGDVIKGNNQINTVVKDLVRKGTINLGPLSQKEDNLDSIKEKLDEFTKEPMKMTDIGQDLSYYSPEYGVAVGQFLANATNYLKPLRPDESSLGLFDGNKVPSVFEEERYNNAIQILDNPLAIFNKLQGRELTEEDVMDFGSLYPSLHKSIARKIADEMVDQTVDKEEIPYDLKLQLSLLLGAPLDSTMEPDAIQSAQPKPPMPQGGGPGNPSGGSLKALGKMGSLYQTEDQSRENRRQSNRATP